jgi:myo-inositol-hexaphosphate 3-phosphohydrolase
MATIKGTINNDELLAGSEDIVLGLEGNDEIDAGLGSGGNTLGGGADNDLLYAGTGDLLLGDTGNDQLDASDEGGNNSLYGGEGQDTLYAGENDHAFGGSGDDNIFAGTGNNQLYGGTGRDRFWLANAEVPTSISTVADFNTQADQMVIKLDGVNALTNLSFEQTGSDTLIKLAATGESLAIVQNTASTVFNSNNVIFNETAPLNTSPPVNNPREQDRKTVIEVENLGLVTFSTDTSFKNTQVGGLSGIVYDQGQNRYYAVSDDRSSINPARFYTLEINLSDGRLDNGDVSFTQVTTLLDSEGNPFPTNSLDTEGIVLTENGTVYISSEGEARPDIPRLTNPFVNQFSLSGQQLSELPVAEKYFPTQTGTTGIRNNLAFESLTLTPDGRYLYTATENALIQDGSASTLEDTSLSRIIKYDLTTGQVVAEFVYEVEPIPKASNPIGGFADNGLVELLAIDNNGTLLSLERSFAAGVGNTVKLYQIQTQGALDVSSFDDLFWETENTRFEIDSPVSKKLLVDFQADLGITPDNLEGLSLGPVLPDGRQSLIVVSDNNFSTTQTTQFIALGLEIQTTPAVLPVIETPDVIDDANGETTTLGLLGDADDPAVWIDPDNAEDSLMIGTLKDGGLAVFSLDGKVLQKITPTDILGESAQFGDLRYNNVDVLYNFQLGTETIDIAVVSDRANDTLNLFKIDPTTHTLVNITSSQLLAPAFSIFGVDDGEATVYGLAGYRSPVSGKFYAFVTQASGNKIAQLELKADAQGLITAEVVRTINLPIAEGKTASDYQSEAIVVDQEKGIVYLAVENEIGIVKFAAEPNGGDNIAIVRPVGSPELVPDLEGLAIYYGPNGTGYLVASSQGDSSYAVYSREGSNSYLGSFVVGDNLPAGIDQANETDGLEIINVPLGPTFPFGALLVQDGANNPQNAVENDGELENNNTNFKFVRWDDVANAFETPLMIDPTSYNPRNFNQVPINNPPTAVILSNTVTQLAENTDTTGGIKVATITITDDDQGTNVLSLSGADAASFEIRNNELFFIGNSPDFETKTQYDVTVNVDDKSVGETPDASTDFTLNITNLPDENISDRVSQFNNKGNNLGSLVYNLSDVSGNANTQADNTALEQTDALFHNLVGLYQVENDNGAILDTLDLNGNGLTNDLLNPGDAGYARTAITNAVNNFVLQIGANGNPTDNTSSSEFGDVLLQGGKRYSPFAIANGGNLIPTGGTLQDGINNFLAQNPNNTAANLSNFMTHAVAYFSFGSANPDGAEHLQNRGNNVFGFEDLPGNLGISDFDFNDAVFKFIFMG